MSQVSFVAEVCKLWWDRDFSPAEIQIIELMLNLAIYHQDSPSMKATAAVSQTADSLSAAVAAGILTLGHTHGGAVADLARILQEQPEVSAASIVESFLSLERRLPGFGHRIYKETDPRAQKILEKAAELNLNSKYTQKTLDLEAELAAKKGKKLPLNIDGAMAAVLSDLKIPWQKTNNVFFLARTAGLIYEAQKQTKPALTSVISSQ